METWHPFFRGRNTAYNEIYYSYKRRITMKFFLAFAFEVASWIVLIVSLVIWPVYKVKDYLVDWKKYIKKTMKADVRKTLERDLSKEKFEKISKYL